MNPPNTKIVSNAHVPHEFATVMFLASEPIKRNIPEAIWFTHTRRKKNLKNLQYIPRIRSNKLKQTQSLSPIFHYLAASDSNPMV